VADALNDLFSRWTWAPSSMRDRSDIGTRSASWSAEDLVATITNEVELIRQGTAKAESGPSVEPLSAGCSIFVKLAEGGRFELPVRR
jgi:hypothetical protein